MLAAWQMGQVNSPVFDAVCLGVMPKIKIMGVWVPNADEDATF